MLLYAYSDRAIVALSICIVQIVWIKPKIQPILFYIPFIREISCLSFKKLKEGDGLNDISRQSFAFGRGGVYGLDLKPRVDTTRQFVEKFVIP